MEIRSEIIFEYVTPFFSFIFEPISAFEESSIVRVLPIVDVDLAHLQLYDATFIFSLRLHWLPAALAGRPALALQSNSHVLVIVLLGALLTILLRNSNMSLFLVVCILKSNFDHIWGGVLIEALLVLSYCIFTVEPLDLVLLPLIPLEPDAAPDDAAKEGHG